MLVSKNSRCVGLVASALLFSILLAPTALVAQDGKPTKTDAYYKAVWAKLEAAVAAGKLTKEDAIKKMEAIKKAAGEKNNLKSGVDKKGAFSKGDAVKKGDVKKEVDKKGVANKIDLKKGTNKKSAFSKGEAVKKGDFKKDAFKKGAYSKGNGVKKGNDAVVGLHLETVWVGLRGLVVAGKMSQQEAEAIIGGIKKRIAGGKDVKSPKNVKNPEDVKSGANVKNPKDPNSAVDVDFQKALAELQAAVKAGKLTKEQAVERINTLKKAKQEK